MNLSRSACLAASLFLCASVPSVAQFKTELVNQQGATAPCVGIGPVGGPLAKKCVELFQQAGFIRQDELGFSGLTIGTTGSDDGVITAIAPQSPAALAGLEVGDIITAVSGKPVKPTPAMIAQKALFGPRNEMVRLKIKRAGSDVELTLVRDQQTPPPSPKSSSMFTTIRPMINWRGQFAPCMGAGPAGMAAVEFCYKHFKPFGFIKIGEFSTTGFQLDTTRDDNAVVSTVQPGSVAVGAGVQVGDEIVAVDGQTLTASSGEAAKEMLFGKVGDSVQLTVHHAGADKTVAVTLAAKPKD